jgi:hypothetical protein
MSTDSVQATYGTPFTDVRLGTVASFAGSALRGAGTGCCQAARATPAVARSVIARPAAPTVALLHPAFMLGGP